MTRVTIDFLSRGDFPKYFIVEGFDKPYWCTFTDPNSNEACGRMFARKDTVLQHYKSVYVPLGCH